MEHARGWLITGTKHEPLTRWHMDLPINQIQALAARRLTEQQIADVLDFDLQELKKDRQELSRFREAIRKGAAKGEAELRGALYKSARNGNAFAYNELMRLSRKDND